LVSLSQVASLYTSGLAFFHERFVPRLKRVRGELSGGVWDLSDFVAYAAGSDVDFMQETLRLPNHDGCYAHNLDVTLVFVEL
jgi:hypothetical protein